MVLRSLWIAIALTLAAGGTLPDGEFDISNSWITSPENFFDDFDRLEKRKFFYPKGVGYLNSEAVTYKVLTPQDGFPEIARLSDMCKDAKNQRDYVVNDLMSNHEWALKGDKNNTKIFFYYVPTFAGPVLDGECGPNAEAELVSLMRGLWRRPSFATMHGHDLIMYASSESVHERHLARTRKIAQDHIAYDTAAMEKGDVSLIDYMMSQMTSLEAFYRPSLQFCQLFFPIILPEDIAIHRKDNTTASGESHMNRDDPISWTQYAERRPVEIVMMETIKKDDPKYAVRQKAFEALGGSTGDAKPRQIIALQQSNVAGTQCDWKTIKDKTESIHCIMNKAVSDIEESQHRQELYSRARFALITRGATPHPQSIYDAIKSGTLIINTIDKNLDMALPFQCQVPWEDFTIRIPTHVFDNNPAKAIDEVLKTLDDTSLSKKLKLMKYYRPDILVQPDYGQQSRIVENTMLNALRRCSDEQLLSPRNLTRWNVKCPHMDYGKPSILKRTIHNVDIPPWANF